MAHFAEIDADGVVIRVLVVANEHASRGQEFLADDVGLGGTWVQTSYNSRGGVHYLPNSHTPSGLSHLRFNFAGIGFTYDSVRDAFIPPKPHPEAILDEATCLWVIPPEVLIDAEISGDLTE